MSNLHESDPSFAKPGQPNGFINYDFPSPLQGSHFSFLCFQPSSSYLKLLRVLQPVSSSSDPLFYLGAWDISFMFSSLPFSFYKSFFTSFIFHFHFGLASIGSLFLQRFLYLFLVNYILLFSFSLNIGDGNNP